MIGFSGLGFCVNSHSHNRETPRKWPNERRAGRPEGTARPFEGDGAVLVHAAEHGGADARRDEDERGVALGQAEAARRRGEVDEVAGREVAEDVRDPACREAVSCGNAADQASTTEGVAISPSTSRMAAIR